MAAPASERRQETLNLSTETQLMKKLLMNKPYAAIRKPLTLFAGKT